jgi:stage II sporulation protein AB (anti-sigma F factor)
MTGANMNSKNVMELRLLSLSENESFARSVVGAFATQLDPTLEEVADIKTAVSEAVTNCIVHAYPDCVGDIRITAELAENRVTVKIQDYGIGIADIDQARQPFYSTSKDESRSGMGFTVMETFMDEISVESEPGRGTAVTMTKSIKKQE